MIDCLRRREEWVDNRPWYKKLWVSITMKMMWHWPITRHIYQKIWLRYFSRQFRKVCLPVIKQSFAEFDAKEFVRVQPMTDMPPGTVFPLDFVYDERKHKKL